jgi:hypothetical protein
MRSNPLSVIVRTIPASTASSSNTINVMGSFETSIPGCTAKGCQRKENMPHRLDTLDNELKARTCIRLLRFRNFDVDLGGDDCGSQTRPFNEGLMKCHAEPEAKLLSVADRTPYPLMRCAQ